MVGARSLMASSGSWSSGNSGEVAPVGIGRGVVCELCEDEAELEMGSAQAEEVGNGGLMVSFELTGVRVDGSGVLGFRGGEPERERAE